MPASFPHQKIGRHQLRRSLAFPTYFFFLEAEGAGANADFFFDCFFEGRGVGSGADLFTGTTDCEGARVIVQISDVDGAGVVGGGGSTILTSFPFSSASNTSHLILTFAQVTQAEANPT